MFFITNVINIGDLIMHNNLMADNTQSIDTNKIMIDVKNITMKFKMEQDSGKSLKEFFVKTAKNRLSYDEMLAVNNVSFNIKKGEVVGVIGTNGAGKSTLLKLISGVLKPTEGTVSIYGSIAPMLELGAGFNPDLTGRENIFLNGAILGFSRAFLQSRYKEIVDFSELGDFINVPIRTYSSGMVMRLAFSISTLVSPDILIVDEILSVGDAHFKKKSENRMRQLMDGGATVLLVSHAISQIKDLSSRVIWLEKGIIKMDGDVEKVCHEYEKTID